MSREEKKPEMTKEKELPDGIRGEIHDDGMGIKNIESKVSTNGDWTTKDYYCSYADNSKPKWAGSESTCTDGRYEISKRINGMYGGHAVDETDSYDSKGGRLLSKTTRSEGYEGAYTKETETYTYSEDGSERTVSKKISGSEVMGQGSDGKARLGNFSSVIEYTNPSKLKPDGTYTPTNEASYKETKKFADGSKRITKVEKFQKVHEEERWPNGHLKSIVDFVDGKPKNRQEYDKNGKLKQNFLAVMAKYGMTLTGNVLHCGCKAVGKAVKLVDNVAQRLMDNNTRG